MAGRFADGFSAGGTRFGYRSVQKARGYLLEIDPAEATVIRRIYTEAAAGVTPRNIAAGLDRDHIPKPCCGYETADGSPRTKTPWSPNTVRSILRNEKYAGQWRYMRNLFVGRHPDTGKRVSRPAPDGETLQQDRKDLVIVDRKLWDKVQAVMDDRAGGIRHQVVEVPDLDPTTGRPKVNPDGSPKMIRRSRLCGREKGSGPGFILHPLAGLLKCGVCGGPMSILLTRTNKEGRLVRSVGCVRNQRYATHCGNSGVIRIDFVEETLADALSEFFSNSKLMQAHMKRFYSELSKARRVQSAAESKARADLAAADAELAKIKALVLRVPDSTTADAWLREAEGKQAEASKRLAEAEEMRTAAPAMLPPEAVLAGLRAQHQRERRETYRRLLTEVRLTSHRAKGKKFADYWVAEFTPNVAAGITGLPTSVAFSKKCRIIGHDGEPRRTRTGGLANVYHPERLGL